MTTSDKSTWCAAGAMLAATVYLGWQCARIEHAATSINVAAQGIMDAERCMEKTSVMIPTSCGTKCGACNIKLGDMPFRWHKEHLERFAYCPICGSRFIQTDKDH